MTTKAKTLRMIALVRSVVDREIEGSAKDGGRFGRGLASEGRAGGYRQALDDVEAFLRHGSPSDHMGYWRRAAEGER